MIPQEQLKDLKPLPDQVIRERMIKSKRTISFRKGRLTKRARQFACYVSNPLKPTKIKLPSGVRWYGNKPLKNNPRKQVKK